VLLTELFNFLSVNFETHCKFSLGAFINKKISISFSAAMAE